jgi:uncharacterized membrane protein
MKPPDSQVFNSQASDLQANGAGATTFRAHWQELDVLRGIAAVMMVVNHVGVKLLSPQQAESGLTGELLFAASFAPVIFFFVTGVGAGIQSSQRKKASRWTAVLNKAGILLLADLLLAWSNGEGWRLDFLGFIGLSIVVLELIRISKAPIALSAAGVVGITLLRYGVGAIVAHFGFAQHLWGINFVLGTALMPNVSYPLSPWLAYPLLGFIAGAAIARLQKRIEQQRLQAIVGILGIAVLPALASLFFAFKGAVFFRWGSMSLAFYILSFVAISVCFAMALVFCSDRCPRFLSKGLSLRGISSLAVVPVHYFLIDLLGWFGIGTVQPTLFAVWAIGVTAFSFFLASMVEREGHALRKTRHQSLLKNSLVGVFVASACVTLTLNHTNFLTAISARTIGELALCLLFVLPLSPVTVQTSISDTKL